MMAEEAAELIIAMNHYKRGRVGAEKVLEEMTDVCIIIEGLKILFGESNFNLMFHNKCRKMEKQLEGKSNSGEWVK